MRQSILDAAIALMTQNGQTTTLEVKLYLRDKNKHVPGYLLYQTEVSKHMADLAISEGWIKEPSSNGNYQIYKLNPNKPAPRPTPVVGVNIPPAVMHINANDPMVGYIRSNKGFYVTGADKNDVRRKLYQLANHAFGMNISYDDINHCSQNFYNTHHK
jgi:hypothetical protein